MTQHIALQERRPQAPKGADRQHGRKANTVLKARDKCQNQAKYGKRDAADKVRANAYRHAVAARIDLQEALADYANLGPTEAELEYQLAQESADRWNVDLVWYNSWDDADVLAHAGTYDDVDYRMVQQDIDDAWRMREVSWSSQEIEETTNAMWRQRNLVHALLRSNRELSEEECYELELDLLDAYHGTH